MEPSPRIRVRVINFLNGLDNPDLSAQQCLATMCQGMKDLALKPEEFDGVVDTQLGVSYIHYMDYLEILGSPTLNIINGREERNIHKYIVLKPLQWRTMMDYNLQILNKNGIKIPIKGMINLGYPNLISGHTFFLGTFDGYRLFFLFVPLFDSDACSNEATSSCIENTLSHHVHAVVTRALAPFAHKISGGGLVVCDNPLPGQQNYLKKKQVQGHE
jgi:hypothetical protein